MAGAWACWLVAGAVGCPLCGVTATERLGDRLARTPVVLYGTLSNARQDPSATSPTAGATDMLVKRVVKAPPRRTAAGKTERLEAFIPTDRLAGKPTVILADLDGDRLLPYAGLDDSEGFVDYLCGVVELEGKPATARLAFFYKRLDDRNAEVARDAFMEFVAAPFADVLAAAGKYDPAHLRALLVATGRPDYEKGLLGMMLGMCGRTGKEGDKDSDAAFLAAMIADPEKRPISGLDGLMGGYCILERRRGPELLLGLLGDKRTAFAVRYSALRALGFVLADLDRIDRPGILAALSGLAVKGEDRDLVIEELAKVRHWSAGPAIYPLFGAERGATRMLKIAVLRFALACPEPHAKAFLAEAAKLDPRMVAGETELHRWDAAMKARQEAEANRAKAAPAPAPAGRPSAP